MRALESNVIALIQAGVDAVLAGLESRAIQARGGTEIVGNVDEDYFGSWISLAHKSFSFEIREGFGPVIGSRPREIIIVADYDVDGEAFRGFDDRSSQVRLTPVIQERTVFALKNPAAPENPSSWNATDIFGWDRDRKQHVSIQQKLPKAADLSLQQYIETNFSVSPPVIPLRVRAPEI